MDLTPIKVRGKRHGTQAEKWNYGKRRKIKRPGSPTSSVGTSGGSGTGSRSKTTVSLRKRKFHDPALSRLEELPNEILQQIFVLAGNVDLALASPNLATQLSSAHVHHQLTSQVLPPILGCSDASSKVRPVDLSTARRLLNSKFFTWPFFQDWVQGYTRNEATANQSEQPPVQSLWQDLEPCAELLPPKKLLVGPWPSDKVAFLGTLSQSEGQDLAGSDSVSGEIARDGLAQAITEGCESAVRMLLRMGLTPDTALLRHAVIDSGCDQGVVTILLDATTSHQSEHGGKQQELATGGSGGIDFLDPALWAWADQQQGEKGSWIKRQLSERASPTAHAIQPRSK